MSSTMMTLPGQDTLVACWQALAQLSPGARLVHSSTALAAVFPQWAPLNNAIVLPVPDGTHATEIAAGLRPEFAEAGIETWAMWLPSPTTNFEAPDEVRAVDGFARDTSTLVMRMELAGGLRTHGGVIRTSIAVATRATDELVPIHDLEEPDGVPGLDGWVLVQDGFAVAGVWTFVDGGKCGIYSLGTHPDFRRHGLARSLMEHVLTDAHRHGARTATLQSTPMGQRLYESLGFDPAGRYEEWVTVK